MTWAGNPWGAQGGMRISWTTQQATAPKRPLDGCPQRPWENSPIFGELGKSNIWENPKGPAIVLEFVLQNKYEGGFFAFFGVCKHIYGNHALPRLYPYVGSRGPCPMLLLPLTCCWRAISILWLGAFRWFKNLRMILHRTFWTPQMGRKDNPSRGFCIFQPLFASSIIHLPSVTAAKEENLGQLTGFPLAPLGKSNTHQWNLVSIKW